MKRFAIFMIFMLLCATLVVSSPFRPEGRKDEREMLLTELLRPILRELQQPSTRSIESKVLEIIVEQLGVDPEEVKPEAVIVDDLGADSLETVELVMALEEEFDTHIPYDEAEELQTVQQVVDYLRTHVMHIE